MWKFDLMSYLIGVACGIIIALIVFSPSAKAHSWYSPECCHDRDCSPVTSMEQMDNKNPLNKFMIVTTKLGKGYTTQYTKWLKSEDDKDHACINVHTNEVICFYGAQRY